MKNVCTDYLYYLPMLTFFTFIVAIHCKYAFHIANIEEEISF